MTQQLFGWMAVKENGEPLHYTSGHAALFERQADAKRIAAKFKCRVIPCTLTFDL